MKKLVVVAIVIAVAGWFAYAKPWQPKTKRACAHLHALCGGQERDADDRADDCTDFFDALRNDGSAADADKTAQCVLDAKSCPEAAGCMAGGGLKLGTTAAKSFLDGMQKSLH